MTAFKKWRGRGVGGKSMNKYKKIKTRVKKTNKQTNKQSKSKSINPKKYITAKEKNSSNNICTRRLLFLGYRSLIKDMHMLTLHTSRNLRAEKNWKAKEKLSYSLHFSNGPSLNLEGLHHWIIQPSKIVHIITLKIRKRLTPTNLFRQHTYGAITFTAYHKTIEVK